MLLLLDHLIHLLERLLPLLLPTLETHKRVRTPNRHLLVIFRGESRKGLLSKFLQRHAKVLALLTVLKVVELGLDRGRVQLDDLDIRVCILELLAHHKDGVVQSGLGGTVDRTSQNRHES